MSIKTEQIKYVANLARIELSETEVQALSEQLNKILEYMDKLGELDTSKTEPMSHTLNITNVARKDEVKESISRKDALQNAPLSDGEFFEVPKII